MRNLRRHLAQTAALAALAIAACSSVAAARTNIDLNVFFRADVPANRPVSVVYDADRPDVELVPGTSIYYVRNADHDIYRYGKAYWVYDDGYWYQSRHWDGPWMAVSYQSVPSQIYYVPTAYRPHWQAVQPGYQIRPAEWQHYQGRHDMGRRGHGYDNRNDRGNGNGNGHGNGRGNGHDQQGDRHGKDDKHGGDK